jgi:cysteine desulfurase/selenocysteine lyase
LEKKAKLGFLPLDDENSVKVGELKKIISEKTKIVSLFHVNNSFGNINNILEISREIKKINKNCFIIVDACQSISHIAIDVKK